MKKVSAGYYIKRGLLVVLCGVFLGVFIFAAYQLYTTFHGYREAEKEYSSLNEQYVSTEVAPTPEVTEEEEEVVVNGPITVDFDALKAENPEVVGWIYGPNSPISYPVVKGTDNEYYLYHSFQGALNQSGTIFMDTVCETDLSQDNTIIYGHHMNNGGMFATINNYINAGYYEEHPVLYYYTPDEIYVLEVFTMFVTGGDSDVYAFNFATDDDYAKFLNSVTARSNFPTDVSVTTEDHIMTLSTCAYDYDDARYVVICKIVPIREAGISQELAEDAEANSDGSMQAVITAA